MLFGCGRSIFWCCPIVDLKLPAANSIRLLTKTSTRQGELRIQAGAKYQSVNDVQQDER
jgi:hypothetical protein